LKVMDLWMGPALSDPSCASAYMVFSWMVRDPFPDGGDELEFRKPVPMAGGLTEKFAEGRSGQFSTGWCSEIEVVNASLQPYSVEVRYASGE